MSQSEGAPKRSFFDSWPARIAAIAVAVAIGGFLWVKAPKGDSDSKKKGPPPAKAAKKLVEGNKRFRTGAMKHPNQDDGRRAELTGAQHPHTTVLCCSDSRVPPELLFDQGLGDIFVVRTAGEVVDDAAMGSLEYAAEHLHVRLLVVLGHTSCGAVKATLENSEKGGEVPGKIGSLVEAIKPAVAKGKAQPGDKLRNSIEAQVHLVVERLKGSEPILKELIEKNELEVAGAVYHLESGEVEWVTDGVGESTKTDKTEKKKGH